MSEALLAQTLSQRCAEPAVIGEGIKAQMRRAFQRVSGKEPRITYRRVKSLWYGEVPDDNIRFYEVDVMQRLLRERQRHEEFSAKTRRMAAAYSAEGAAMGCDEGP